MTYGKSILTSAAMLGAMATLAGCGDPPQSVTTSSYESTPAPAPPPEMAPAATTTTTTTNAQTTP